MRLLMAPVLLLGALTSACDRQTTPQPQAQRAEAAQAADDHEDATEVDDSGIIDQTKKGSPMPEATFEGPHGEPVTLSQFKGKPLLINLWATWCAPCVAEMPALDALSEREAQRLQLMVVSQDMQGRAVVDPWWAKRDFKRLIPYLDADGDLPIALDANALPVTVLYDADGREVWRVLGPMDWAGERANALLAGKP